MRLSLLKATQDIVTGRSRFRLAKPLELGPDQHVAIMGEGAEFITNMVLFDDGRNNAVFPHAAPFSGKPRREHVSYDSEALLL